MQTLLDEAAETGVTVVLSSHVIAELEGACNHLLLLSDGRVRLEGHLPDLLAGGSVAVSSLEELVLPYLRSPAGAHAARSQEVAA
jgi:ABC-2 type transport system ATP-binding protein